MSVHFHKPRNCWFYKWREDGKEKRRYFKTEAEAQTYETERLADTSNSQSRLTLGELTISYFKARPDFHYHTKANIVNFLATGAGSFLRDKYAESLSRQDLEAIRNAMWNKGTGNNTINKYQAYIRAILAWGVDQDLIRINPWRDYKKLKVKKPIFQPKVDDLRRLYPELPDYCNGR